MLIACFTAEAVAHYHKGFEAEVRLYTAVNIARFLLKRTLLYAATNHQACNIRICVRADSASSVIHALAHLLLASEPKILVRGMRYEDELIRIDDTWRIRSRLHTPRWQYEAVAVRPAIPLGN